MGPSRGTGEKAASSKRRVRKGGTHPHTGHWRRRSFEHRHEFSSPHLTECYKMGGVTRGWAHQTQHEEGEFGFSFFVVCVFTFFPFHFFFF